MNSKIQNGQLNRTLLASLNILSKYVNGLKIFAIMYNILLYFSYSKSVFLKSCKVYFSDIVICISSISWPNFWLGANSTFHFFSTFIFHFPLSLFYFPLSLFILHLGCCLDPLHQHSQSALPLFLPLTVFTPHQRWLASSENPQC